jgi:hypothetical protein
MTMDPIDVSNLSDSALALLAWEKRREALHGNRDAFGVAHELERELRRREGRLTGPAPLINTMPPGPSTHRPWWRFWS